MHFIKADTASRIVLGPFVDVTDGHTMESTVQITAADQANAIKYDPTNGFSSVALTGTLTAIVDGYYWYSVPATLANEEGWMRIVIEDNDLCLPVWEDFMVVNANVYDSLFAVAATDYLQTDTIQVASSTTSGTNLSDLVTNAFDATNNHVHADVKAINDITAAAQNLEQIMRNAIPFTCDAAGSTSTINTSLPASGYTTNDQFNGRVAIFDFDTTQTSALRGQAGVIIDYDGTTGVLTFAANTFTAASANGDTGIIL